MPYIENAIRMYGDKAWPEEWSIKVYNKERKWDGYFHPSMHASADPLLLFYEFHPRYTLEPEKITSDTFMTWQVGMALHAVVESSILHLGLTREEEIEVPFTNKKRWCSGRVDVRYIYLPTGEVVGPVDIKSTGYLPAKPFPENVAQIQPYMDLGCNEQRDKGYIIYVEKGHPHRMREFTVQRDDIMLQGIYTKWQRVLEAVEFDDPSSLQDCCNAGTKMHRECPARFICRIGRPPVKAGR